MSIETFASPGLRWGLLLEDHPRATHEFELKKGTVIGIPSEYGGDGNFCVCTIHIPGQEPIVAYKEAPKRKDPDEWVVACTKTLGRALKKAGYPDDLKDLKALVLWRQRNAEVAAIGSGQALTAGPAPLEIEAGGRDADDDGRPDVDHDATDDDVQPAADTRGYETDINSGDDSIVDAEVVEDEPSGDTKPIDFDKLLEEVEGLNERDRRDLDKFLRANDIPDDPNAWTPEDLVEIDSWFEGPS